ncbi:hypothetical protein [Runella aurantiaca]|uniref:Outer membrane protein beta-barrel domain-containing protein n=1 Tax=Runella aurantiaca TaxID=2282308 RepID=A0A369IC36_9BACT|nr:hypothetical protein [Runella aurantiaca]RDB06440.1 hypothetical protein DVG78_09315 [Runella aurantiaca]
MQEFPDDSLDDLFRKSAEEFEPEFEPKAWAAMRKKLDSADTTNGAPKKRTLLSLVLLLLLFSGVIVGGVLLWPRINTPLSSKPAVAPPTTQQSSTSTTEARKQPKKIKPAETASEYNSSNPETNYSESNPESATKNAVETEAVVPDNSTKTKVVTSGKAKASKTFLGDNKIANSTNNPENIGGDSPSLPAESNAQSTSKTNQQTKADNLNKSTRPSLALSDKPLSTSDDSKISKKAVKNTSNTPKSRITDSLLSKNNAANNTKKQGGMISEYSIGASNSVSKESTSATVSLPSPNGYQESTTPMLRVSTPNTLTIHPWHLLSVAYASPAVSYISPPPPPLVAKPTQAEAEPLFRKGLSLRILVAPDLSYIGFDQMKRPGITLGAMLEYRFSQRISVQAGAVRAIKLYDATGSQYVWPEVWNFQKARPSGIEAACKVLDIPLNVRYDITQSANKRWFVSTGITSYKMLNEKYIYTYPPRSYNIKWYDWEGSTGSYWFGVLNFSMGFERQIGKKISLQAEPYFKLPLAQVGLGKIKLNTAGLFISARYRLGRF